MSMSASEYQAAVLASAAEANTSGTATAAANTFQEMCRTDGNAPDEAYCDGESVHLTWHTEDGNVDADVYAADNIWVENVHGDGETLHSFAEAVRRVADYVEDANNPEYADDEEDEEEDEDRTVKQELLDKLNEEVEDVELFSKACAYLETGETEYKLPTPWGSEVDNDRHGGDDKNPHVRFHYAREEGRKPWATVTISKDGTTYVDRDGGKSYGPHPFVHRKYTQAWVMKVLAGQDPGS